MRDLLEPISESKAKIRDNRRYHDSTWSETGMYCFSFIVHSVQRISTTRDNLQKERHTHQWCQHQQIPIYAGDTVTLTESEKQLQVMLDRIIDKCKEYGMEINAKKTKTMLIGRDTKALTMTVGNAVLGQILKYLYLGHMIMEDIATLKEGTNTDRKDKAKVLGEKRAATKEH
ncbi:reverse transcriptase [Elysia marginata]|uniref:Reverse transcriptase n=1 Tax=Elysia marginata TaxID=1093978 RepID=A0AAV4ISZ3_9GAST|nr:reverse transcriptase [Elysia marginata]